jgi:hypothetical protein
VNDVVLQKDKTTARQTYKYAQVIKVYLGTDGKVPSSDVEYKISGESKFRVSTRPIHNLVLVIPLEEQTMEESTCLGERGIPTTEEESAREQVDQTQAGKTEELEPVDQHHETPREVHDDVYDNRQDDRRGMNQPGGSCAIETKDGTKTPAIPKVIFQSSAQDRVDVAQVVRRGRGRPRKDCSLGAKREDNEEPVDPDKGSVPDRKMGNCLDTKLPGTSLQEGGKKGPALPVPVKRVS